MESLARQQIDEAGRSMTPKDAGRLRTQYSDIAPSLERLSWLRHFWGVRDRRWSAIVDDVRGFLRHMTKEAR